MKKSKLLLHLFFAVLLSVCLLSLIDSSNHHNIRYTGIASAFDDASEAYAGLGRFFGTIKSAMDPITGILGIKIIILFLGALFIGTGLAFLGLPKGRASFLTSLVIANFIWFTWVKSFNPEEFNYTDQFLSMLKADLILLHPFIFIFILKRIPFFSQKVIPRVRTLIIRAFVNKRALNNKEILSMSENFQEASMKFQQSLVKDILEQRGNEEIVLSGDTMNLGKEVEKVLKGLREGWIPGDRAAP